MLRLFRSTSMSIILLMLLCFPSVGLPHSSPQRKVTQERTDMTALVIGSNDYPTAPLKNPINDAKAISSKLSDLGFQVNVALDVNLRAMEKAIDRFISNLKVGSIGLFYYAGHGMQIDGENYLVPTDFIPTDEADAKYSSYSASRLMERMERAGTKLNIIIIDACRNNPFLPSRSTSRGLAIMNSGQGTFLAFATGPGKTADDNPKAANGLFTICLLEALKEPGLSLDQVFNRVRERVASASSRKQVPWTVSSVIGEFYFNVSESKPVPPGVALQPTENSSHKTPASSSSKTTQPRLPFESRVEHSYAHSEAVKIHCASIGKGSLIIMIHGFPDFWYTWRDQMEALSEDYQVVAIDQRGYNLSDKPQGVENYDLKLLVKDVASVIRHMGREKAIVVAHDWAGGTVAWTFAMTLPEMTEKLIILNMPHPRGLLRELANNPQQQKNSQYARNFQQPDAHTKMTAAGLSGWVKDPEAKKKYIEAFNRSDIEAMLNYYRRNFPKEPYTQDTSPVIKVKAPVLIIHGLKDTALLPGALDNTREWVEHDFLLVTVPGAGHFVQQDASDQVTRTIRSWLAR